MPDIFNIYCDESRHLENDGEPIMGFGALLCPADRLAMANIELAALKEKHRARGELKWEKVSVSREQFYFELIDWFFLQPELRFRGWLVDHKERLDHEFFGAGDHDAFYYKMFYYLLDPLVARAPPGQNECSYRIYLDVKDTRSRLKVRRLAEVLRTRKHDTDESLISRVQSAPADELQIMQLTDFLIGALTYRNRTAANYSKTKIDCVNRIEARAGYALTGGTPPWEEKFNFYTFTPKETAT